MADEQIVTNIVARSDFSGLIADVQRTTAALAKLQQELSITNKTLAAQAGQIQKSFSDTLRSTGQFSSHFVTVGSDVEKFGRSLDGGKLKLKDYFRTWQAHTRTSGGLIRDLAKQQVALQNAVVQPLGKTADGLMKFNVQVPKGLDLVANKTILARKELQIYNKVIQDGGVQLINWGKNTQWAGRQLTVGLTVPIAAFGMAAAKAFREADQELVRLTKVYGGIAATSAVDLANVRKDVSQTARELAAAYGSSFKDTISLAADIAATGKTGNELLASTKETTRLAVLGEVDRQDAMKATLALQNAFKQNTTELAESINFLNAVENQTSTSLGDLIEAIPKAGPVVQSLGGDVQDLALYLTAMKEGGINASEGANALKSALASMINPTKVAREMFSGLGIDLGGIVTQNAGNLTATITALQSSLDKLNPLQKSQAIEQLFGKFQFARLSALFENLGKEGSQTLQVMDLMKASSADLANVAGRELSQITESASGKYQRALQTLKADLAGVGESFLTVQTFFLNLTSSIVNFLDKMPGPIKSLLTLVGGITALAGPLIMLTGVFANFIGYVIKGIGHLKSLFKGGEGFRLLTPEIIAADKAGSLIEKTFYSDAAAADILSASLKNLITEFTILQQKAASGAISVKPTIATIAGTVAMAGTPNGGYRGVTVDPSNPLVGNMGTRASAHMNPVGNMSEAERAAQTIFGMVPAPIPVNRKIGKNPQMYMSGGALPSIPGLTSIGGVSTGVVAEEAAKWHAMTGALAMQSEAEITALKREVLATGTVTTELSTSYQALLPEITSLTKLAAQEGAAIVAQVQAGAVSVDQARARIVALNAQVEAMIAETTANIAIAQGRSANLTTVPLTNQPVVDPRTGKSNMKELFHKTPTADLVNNVARALGAIRTSGGGYSTATTIQNRNQGGPIYYNDGSRSVVPGPNVNRDVVPAMLTPGEFVVNRAATQANLPLLQAINGGRGAGGINHIKGGIIPTLQNILSTLFSRKTAIGATRGVTTSSKGQQRTSGYNAFSTPGALTDGIGYPHFSGQKFWETKLGRELNRLYGLQLPKTVKGSKSQSEVNLHAIHPDFIDKYGASSGRSSTPDLSGTSLINLGVSGKIDADKSYRILPAMSVRGSKEFNESLARGTATASQWRRINGSNLTDLALMLHSAGVPPRVIKDILARTANQINYRVIKNGNTPIGESEFGSIVFDASEEALLNSVSKKTGSWIGLNLGGKVPGRAMGGPVSGASPYVVGENGPELFVPQNSGKIIPGFNNGGQVQHLAAGGQVMAMLLRMIPGIAGYQLGSQLTGGSMMGGMAGSIGGDVIGTALANKILNIGKAADQVTKKVSLSQKVLNVFSKSPKIGWIGAIVAGATVLKSVNDRINEHRRVINLAFGQTAETAAKLGINYKSLNDQLKEFKEKTDLAAAAANAFYASSTLTEGLSITIEEFQKLKENVQKELPDLIKVFDDADSDEVVKKASQLKAQFISGGMSAEKATHTIRALVESSNKASMSLALMGDKGFGSIVDKSSAAVAGIETFNSLLKAGNSDQIGDAFYTLITGVQEMEKSLIGTEDETGKIIDSSEAWAITMEKVNAAQGSSASLTGAQYYALLRLAPELKNVLNGSENTAGAIAKWKIYISGAKVELKSMSDEMAIAFATAQVNLMEALGTGKTGTDLDKIVKAIKAASSASLINKDIIQKNAEISKESLEKEIKLHEKNIDKIKEEADARRKSLSRQSEDEDILTQIKKKQLEYQDSLAMGDSAAAAQAQLDIQMLQRNQEKTLALREIDDKEAADTKLEQSIIDNLRKKLEANSKTLQGQLDSVADATSKVEKLMTLLDDIKQFIASSGTTTSEEELKAANLLQSRAEKLGLKVKLGATGTNATGTDWFSTKAGIPAFSNLSTGIDSILNKVLIGNKSLRTEDVNALKNNGILTKILDALTKKPGIDSKDLITEGNRKAITPQTLTKYGITPDKGKTSYIGKIIESDDQKYQIISFDPALGFVLKKLALGGPIQHYEPGGNVRGPGTGTSDSIPAMLSNGEYVIRASSVAKYGAGTFDALNAGRFADGGLANAPKYPKQISVSGGKWPVKPKGSPYNDIPMPDRKDYKTEKEWLQAVSKSDPRFYTPPPKEYGIDGIKSPMGTLSRFIDIARSQIGKGHNYRFHTESNPKGYSDTDVNKYSIEANAKYKLGSDALWWCGAFVAWVAQQSGVKISDKMFSAFQATKDYKKQGLFNDLNVKDNFKNLKLGDLAWFDYSDNPKDYSEKGDGVPDHAAIVSKVFGKNISAIGWFGSSSGDEVKEVNIKNKQHLFGSVSPSFAKLAMGGPVKHYKPGGNVKGPGTSTSDSIPAMLSNGEYVIKADSVKKYGVDTFDALNAQRLHKGGKVGHKHYNPRMASDYKAPYSGPSISALTPANAGAASAKATDKWYKDNDYYKDYRGEWVKRGPSQWEKYTTLQNWKDLLGGQNAGHGVIANDVTSKILTTLMGPNAAKRNERGQLPGGGEIAGGLANIMPLGFLLRAGVNKLLPTIGINKLIPSFNSILGKTVNKVKPTLSKVIDKTASLAYKPINFINQFKNYSKVLSMIKNGLFHGSQPTGLRGEDYLQGRSILDGAETYDPFYGMGFFGTTSKSEADMYAGGYNSYNNWGESFGSIVEILKAPWGKYIDFTKGTNSIKRQSYALWKALGVKKDGYIGDFMPENLGDIMSSVGLRGGIMNRISAGQAPGDINDAKWVAWNNPAGVETLEEGFKETALRSPEEKITNFIGKMLSSITSRLRHGTSLSNWKDGDINKVLNRNLPLSGLTTDKAIIKKTIDELALASPDKNLPDLGQLLSYKNLDFSVMALRPKTTHGTITHEGVHALDIKTLTSVKAFIEEVGKTRSPADAVKVGRLWLSAQNATNPMNEFDNSLINNKLHHKLFTGIVEKTAVDGQFNAYKNSNFFGKLRLGNPLAREGGYLEDWDQFLNYSKGWSTRDRLDFIQGLSTSKNLSSTIQNKYSSWVRRLQNEGSKDLPGSVMKITDNFYDQELPGNVMKITDGYHKGGKVGHKHYNPRMASAYKAPYSGPSISALTPAKAAASAKAMNKLYGKNPDYYKNKNGEWTKKGPSLWETFTTNKNWTAAIGGIQSGPIHTEMQNILLSYLVGPGGAQRYQDGRDWAKGEWTSAAINLALARIAGPKAAALGRTMLEQVGIAKGIPGLGSLLQKGSIPFLGATGSKFAANAAIAAAIGAGKPFLEGKFSTAFSDLRPKIVVTQGAEDFMKKTVKPGWVEHEGRRIPTYSGGPFGEKTIAYQGAGDDFSQLLETGKVSRVIPTNARGLLEYIISQKPGDKKLQAMLANFKSGHDALGEPEREFLTKILAVTNFGPKKFDLRELVSELPKKYLDKIKSDNLEMGFQFPSKTVDQLPEDTIKALQKLKLEEDLAAQRVQDLRYGLPKLQPSTSETGLLLNSDTEGLTTLISSMLGDANATTQVNSRLKMIGPTLSRIVSAYEDELPKGMQDRVADLSKIPMIRSANFGIRYDKNGNITENLAGFEVFDNLFNPSKGMVNGAARVTQHWSAYDPVREGMMHMGGSEWKTSNPLIITSLKNLIRSSMGRQPEALHSTDSWRIGDFLGKQKVLREDASVVTPFTTKKAYVDALKERGLYKEGEKLNLVTESLNPKEVLVQLKKKYSSSDLDEIEAMFDKDRFLPDIERIKTPDLYERKKGLLFADPKNRNSSYTVERLLQIYGVRRGEQQIGIDIPYWEMQPGATEGVGNYSLQAAAAKVGTRFGGGHHDGNLSLLEFSHFGNTKGRSYEFSPVTNPFLQLLDGGTTTTSAAMSAALMHSYFGKLASGSSRAAHTDPDQRVQALISSWVRHSSQYRSGETKTPPPSMAQIQKTINQIIEDRSDRFATGGYVNPSYSPSMSVPQFKDGINMVPADMLAMIHKNEAIVPADMNPFNPNANNATMAPAVYNISMTNNAAEGMDINAFSDIATRKILDQIKRLDAQRASMNGIGRGY